MNNTLVVQVFLDGEFFIVMTVDNSNNPDLSWLERQYDAKIGPTIMKSNSLTINMYSNTSPKGLFV